MFTLTVIEYWLSLMALITVPLALITLIVLETDAFIFAFKDTPIKMTINILLIAFWLYGCYVNAFGS